jgi:glycerol-3-phosphate acyltransferase PlsX
VRFDVFGDEKLIHPELQASTADRGGHHPPYHRRHRRVGKAEPSDPPRQDHLHGHGDQRGEGRPADAAMSGGNTGALMAMAKLALRTMPGSTARHLPRCCRPWAPPTASCSTGANTGCDAQNLVQFAVMGSAYSRTVLGMPSRG